MIRLSKPYAYPILTHSGIFVRWTYIAQIFRYRVYFNPKILKTGEGMKLVRKAERNAIMTEEIRIIEQEIMDRMVRLNQLQKQNPGREVPNYTFQTLEGEVTLLELFGKRNHLLMIHNMGQGCRYCTLWADGFNGFVPHLESALSLVLVSRDAPELQQRFARNRGWTFRMASHGGGAYIREQTVDKDSQNAPGAVVYEKRDGKIYRKNDSGFGPGSIFPCTLFPEV